MNRRNVTNANTDESRYSGARDRRSFPRPFVRTAQDPDLQGASKGDGNEPLTQTSDNEEKQS